jgi:hypothetical protein
VNAWEPPEWEAQWGPDCQDRWRFTLRDADGAVLRTETTLKPITDPHPGTAVYRSLHIAAFPGSPWEEDRGTWTRRVYPVTTKAERDIRAAATLGAAAGQEPPAGR